MSLSSRIYQRWNFVLASGLAVSRSIARAESSDGRWNQLDAKDDPQFVSVTVTGSPVVEISMPCGATIRVPNDSSSLRPVLQTLLEIEARS